MLRNSRTCPDVRSDLKSSNYLVFLQLSTWFSKGLYDLPFGSMQLFQVLTLLFLTFITGYKNTVANKILGNMKLLNKTRRLLQGNVI